MPHYRGRCKTPLKMELRDKNNTCFRACSSGWLGVFKSLR